MTELGFFENVINVGAILAGFCGTFLVFRIQREADYFRNPSDGYIGQQDFTSSFLLLIIATIVIVSFGLIIPLLYLAGLRSLILSVDVVVAGMFAAIVLLIGYFLDEMIHYEIIFINWRSQYVGWQREWPLFVGTVVLGILVFIFWLAILK